LIRGEALFLRGFKIIRFGNEDVARDLDRVCEDILKAATLRLATPHPAGPQPPSPTRGEG
jgi:very-short-patch-repair endonuclease